MKSDLDIAREATLIPISEIAKRIDIPEDALLSYGPYIAKIDSNKIKTQSNKQSKLILVTAMSPTPAGEGKTTTIVNLAITYANLGKKTVLIDADLRKPITHNIFSVDRSPGISEYLANNDKKKHEKSKVIKREFDVNANAELSLNNK